MNDHIGWQMVRLISWVVVIGFFALSVIGWAARTVGGAL